MRKPLREDDRPVVVPASLGTEDDFRNRIRDKLIERGVSGPELDRQVADLMSRDIGFRFHSDASALDSP